MKKLIVAVASAATLFAVSSIAAMAEEATGSIASIDVAAGTVTLDGGKVFRLPATMAMADFKVGQKVKIMFDAGAGPTANALSIVPDQAESTAPGPVGGNAGPTNNAGAPRD